MASLASSVHRLQAWFSTHGHQLHRYPEEEYTQVQNLACRQTGLPSAHLGLARHIYEALDTLFDVFLGVDSKRVYCEIPELLDDIEAMAARRGALLVNHDESGKQQPACTLAIMQGNQPYLAAEVIIRINPTEPAIKPYAIDLLTLDGAGVSPYPPAVVIFPHTAWGEGYAKTIEPFHLPTHLLAEMLAQLTETPLPAYTLPSNGLDVPIQPVQPRIQVIQPYVAGKGIKAMARELNKPESFFVKLASNEHPSGLPAEVIGQIQAHLPDLVNLSYATLYQRLQTALADDLKLQPNQVVIGTGSVDIIKAAVFGLTGSDGGQMLSPAVPFAMYPFEAQKRPARYQTHPLRADNTVDVPAFCQAIRQFGPGLIVLENPRNPLGTAIPDVSPIIEALQPTQVLLLDEAYDDFMRHDCPTWVNGQQLLDRYPDKAILVQRTFSKSFGLAACRVGYAFGSASLVEQVAQNLLPTPVDATSLLTAYVAYTHASTPDWRAATARQNAEQKALLTQCLDKLGLSYVPSYTNFVWIQTPGQDSRALFRQLVEHHGVIVRPAGPEALRVSIGSPADNQRLIAALEAVFQPVSLTGA